MEYTKIIGLTYDLLDEMKTSDEYKELVFLNTFIKTKYKQELKHYHHWFKKFDEVFQIGPYHPDYKETTKNYQQAKKTLFETEEVKKYFLLESHLNDKLSSLSKALNALIPKEEISCVK
ncbi:MAG: YlbF family regulator [Acholeplasmataceae bacterium]